MKLTVKKQENIIALSVSLFSFIIYTMTVNRSIDFIDSGELATVCGTLGIAHPTGYPMFTLIGWIFSHLPLGLRKIHQLNLMSSFLCSATLYFFFRLLYVLQKVILLGQKKNNRSAIKQESEITTLSFLPAILGTITLGFSATFWSQSASIEVYSLHLLFLSILLFSLIRAIYSPDLIDNKYFEEGDGERSWLLFSFLLGISFANHLTTILLAPATIFIFFTTYGFKSTSLKRIAILIIPFIIGFSVYLYLPVRATQHPLLNWGNPIDLERWFWHFSGKVYRVWIFSSTESAAKQFNYFINNLPTELAYYPIIFSIAGSMFLFKRHKKIFIFTSILFLTTLFYSINYDIHDIDSYFLLAYITIAIWVGFGVAWIYSLAIKKIKYHYLTIAGIIFAVIIIFLNYDRAAESKNVIVENYTRDMFKSVDKNSIIISYQWDYFVSAAYYLQSIENEREDVVVIDKELLRRSWYYDQLQNRFPWLFESLNTELNNIRRELNKFEKNLPYNPNVIEYHYQRMIQGIIEKNISNRSIYITPEIEDQYVQGYYKIPSGVAFKLSKVPYRSALKEVDYAYIEPDNENIYTLGIKKLYARSYLNYGLYYNSIENPEEANKYLKMAFEIDPTLKAQYPR
ncbi:MAG: DUF2723 domain-containing protein [Ignavibacteriales bacterium]|nr:DUF2723 domain-containing protein [Ignavibacteriales bacterium]